MSNTKNKIIIFFILISMIKGDSIINNPLTIVENNNNVLIYSQNEYYYVFKSGNVIRINKENGQTNIFDFEHFSAPSIFILDEDNYFYLYANYDIFILSLPNEYMKFDIPGLEFSRSDIIGYIKESKFSNSQCFCSISSAEKIIYGKKIDTQQIIFSFMGKESSYTINLEMDFEDKISCKKIISSQYICSVVDSLGNVYIIVIFLLRIDSQICEAENVKIEAIFDSHTSVELYDTDYDYKKMICARQLNNPYISCLFLTLEMNINSECEYSINLQTENTIEIPIDEQNTNDCAMGHFKDEKLFCCGGSVIIRCIKLDNEYYERDHFDINIGGTVSNLNLFTDGNTFIHFFFKNFKNGIYNFVEYAVYLPTCNNLNYRIPIYNTINVNIENLINRKTNTQHFINFYNLLNNYGEILIDSVKISSSQNYLANNNSELSIVSKNNKTVNDSQILYDIIISEGYASDICVLTLTILPCYDTCSRCTKIKDESNSTNHNCEENKCNTDHYPSPINPTNCFTLQQKESNWYFDSNINQFGLCDAICATCDGPSSNNCLTCNSKSINPQNAYFNENQCINECPQGKYPLLQSEGYYVCTNCYQNCKTCSQGKDNNNMHCDSCPDNYIKYNQNCYMEKDSIQKTFYKDGSTTEFTSCHELDDNFYIQEGTYECIDYMPDTGYTLVNSNTGVFAQCHSDCRICSAKSNSTSTNCELCNNNDYYFLNGNCLSNCPKGYYPALSNGIML